MPSPLRRLLARPDFRRNPLKAVYRRLWWRVRWTFNKSPWILRLPNGLSISTPRGGAGALIYYQGHSEPEVAAMLAKLLRPGMTFWDVGTHIGEYVLLAAPLVGDQGRIEAFEPQPRMFEFLRDNVARNYVTNIDLHDIGIAAERGTAQMSLPPEPSVASIAVADSGTHPTTSITVAPLDTIREITEREPNVIKVDVEGAELLVLNGATGLLDLPADRAPIWIMEYEPNNCTAFYYKAADLLTKFRSHGYFTYWITPKGEAALILEPFPPAGVCNIVATKGARP